ncbi:MAG TPA: hypothetical protein VFG19_03530 [Geobacteraceae bacterium]|nr:hypothetical protein [Geobacteraceae bacterium]
MRHIFVVFFLLFIIPAPVTAGELSLLGGYGWMNNPVQKTFAWQIQYMEGLGEHFAYSLSYLNQGHFIEHHRDVHAANLWFRTNLADRHLSLGVGAGPLFYYDTIHPSNGGPATDFHGWGTMTSVAATWYTESRLLFQVQGYWVRGGQSFNTLSALAGIGYQLDPPPGDQGPDVRGTHQGENTTENELTIFGGQTTVNIPGPGHSGAMALEYRRGIWRYLECTLRALYEGRSGLIDRYGATGQLWLAKQFLNDRIALGAGFGGYLAIDGRQNSDFFASEVVSMSGSYRVSRHWLARITWDRIITSYNRDSDIFLGGIGYRF